MPTLDNWDNINGERVQRADGMIFRLKEISAREWSFTVLDAVDRNNKLFTAKIHKIGFANAAKEAERRYFAFRNSSKGKYLRDYYPDK